MRRWQPIAALLSVFVGVSCLPAQGAAQLAGTVTAPPGTLLLNVTAVISTDRGVEREAAGKARGHSVEHVPPPAVSPQAVTPAAQRKKATWLDPNRAEPAGTHYRTFSSKLAGGEVSYLIYLPPEYDTAPQRRFPVVYWLHGRGGTPRKGKPFVQALNDSILSGSAPAMIAVLVNGLGGSRYLDSPDGKWPVESVIIQELIPHIDRTYRTIPRREARGVEGFSMGGYGAAHLGFKYPDRFSMVGVMAGAMTDCGSFMPDSSKKDYIASLCGPDRAFWEQNHPFALLRKNADRIRGRTVIRVAIGDQDSLILHNQTLHELLVELKIDHEYEVVSGIGHNPPAFYQTLGARAFGWYQRAINAAIVEVRK